MSLKEELAAMAAAEEERLGVGSEDFQKRHRELMEQIDGLMQKNTPEPAKAIRGRKKF